jgi:sugar phosphate isomerase/epimerase
MATHDSLINAASLRAHPDGVALSVQLPWYRSLWLSAVNAFALTVDGVPVPPERLRLELNGRRYPITALREQWDVLWYVQDHGLLVADLDTPLPLGSTHRIDVVADISIVYMQIKPGLYVPNKVHMVRDLTVVDEHATAPVELLVEPTPAPVGRDGLPFKLGLTLYSATAEYAAGLYSLDSLLARVAEAGVGPGIEIVASQVLPTYPVVSDEFADHWFATFDKYGFEPSSFGANLDMGRRRDREMTEDEEFEFTELLFQGARKLGFPLVRIQSVKKDLLRRLIPVADELELKMAYEIHAPSGPNTADVMKIREVYDEFDSPRLGFVADFSATMHSMSPTLLRAVRRMGLDDAAVERMQAIWATDASMFDRQNEFIAYLDGRGIDPGSLGPLARLAFNMHGHVAVSEWADIMPHILHVHAKFYDIDESGEEPAIDYGALVREFVTGGYRGYWSSEWEGHAFADLGDVDPIALVRKQHDLVARHATSLRSPATQAGVGRSLAGAHSLA